MKKSLFLEGALTFNPVENLEMVKYFLHLKN